MNAPLCCARFSVIAVLVALAFPMWHSAAQDGGELAEVKFDLPDPSYSGTPLNYEGPNLEPPSWKPRKPLMAPPGTTNVAKGKTVTSSDAKPRMGKLSQVTDGDKDYIPTSLLELRSGVQWVQIDLEAVCDIHGLLIWHYHESERVYFDIVVRVSDDPEFKDDEKVIMVFNNDHDISSKLGLGKDKEYVEKYKGKLLRTKDLKGRYVRLYSNGNTSDGNNHYVEVEVYGKPAG